MSSIIQMHHSDVWSPIYHTKAPLKRFIYFELMVLYFLVNLVCRYVRLCLLRVCTFEIFKCLCLFRVCIFEMLLCLCLWRVQGWNITTHFVMFCYVMLCLGLPQDSSLEWKSDSQFIFLDENPCTLTDLCALSNVLWQA